MLPYVLNPLLVGLPVARGWEPNSAAPKRGRCEEKLPCPKHHRERGGIATNGQEFIQLRIN